LVSIGLVGCSGSGGSSSSSSTGTTSTTSSSSNTTNGTNGTNGTSGTNGTNGTHGTNGTNGTTGTNSNATTGTTSNTTTTGTTTGTTGTVNCSSQATTYCQLFNQCDPTGFIAAYDNEATCERVYAAGCGAAPIPDTNGVHDAAACFASETANCTAFLAQRDPAYVPPTSCQANPGSLADQDACGYSAQCPAGDWCNPFSDTHPPMCMDYTCAGFTQSGQDCGNSDESAPDYNYPCDPTAGQACTKPFDPTNGLDPNASQWTCATVTRGQAGASCFPGSTMQCDVGFACNSSSKKCVAYFAEGTPCTTSTAYLCDLRLGLTCQDDGSGTGSMACLGSQYVTVASGSQCGAVPNSGGTGTHQVSCSAYAYCGGPAPTVCLARRQAGQGCTASPDNCEPGLMCGNSGTCQTPPAGNCN
jgi:hypothetical protein